MYGHFFGLSKHQFYCVYRDEFHWTLFVNSKTTNSYRIFPPVDVGYQCTMECRSENLADIENSGRKREVELGSSRHPALVPDGEFEDGN